MKKIKNAVYKAVDLLTGGRGIKRTIGGAEIQLPARLCRFYKPDYEPDTVTYLRQTLREGDTFLDIGAHIGLFTVLAAKLVGRKGRVVSFEPSPLTRSALSDVVRMNRCDGVVAIRHEAISSSNGKAVFFGPSDIMSVTNSLVKNETSSESFEVETAKLDEFVSQTGSVPNCVKIDVEGAELDVLLGGQTTFLKARPRVRLSMHPGFYNERERTTQEIWSVLCEYGYGVDLLGERVDRSWFVSQTGFFDVNLTPLTQ